MPLATGTLRPATVAGALGVRETMLDVAGLPATPSKEVVIIRTATWDVAVPLEVADGPGVVAPLVRSRASLEAGAAGILTPEARRAPAVALTALVLRPEVIGRVATGVETERTR